MQQLTEHGIVPVSYTHLDVYKRQSLNMLFILPLYVFFLTQTDNYNYYFIILKHDH